MMRPTGLPPRLMSKKTLARLAGVWPSVAILTVVGDAVVEEEGRGNQRYLAEKRYGREVGGEKEVKGERKRKEKEKEEEEEEEKEEKEKKEDETEDEERKEEGKGGPELVLVLATGRWSLVGEVGETGRESAKALCRVFRTAGTFRLRIEVGRYQNQRCCVQSKLARAGHKEIKVGI